jgi:hypothetical protein
MQFETNDLLSKWGFGDGCILDNLLLDNNHPLSLSAPLLRHIARENILPHLNQVVTVEDSCKMHNPIRAISVDGTDVDCKNNTLLLTPKIIEISEELILAKIASLDFNKINKVQ